MRQNAGNVMPKIIFIGHFDEIIHLNIITRAIRFCA